NVPLGRRSAKDDLNAFGRQQANQREKVLERPLPADTLTARICSYECTFCADCAENKLQNVCPTVVAASRRDRSEQRQNSAQTCILLMRRADVRFWGSPASRSAAQSRKRRVRKPVPQLGFLRAFSDQASRDARATARDARNCRRRGFIAVQ